MGTRSQAQSAVEALNGVQIIEGQRPLLVKFADDDKRRQLMARYLPQSINLSSGIDGIKMMDSSNSDDVLNQTTTANLAAQMANLSLSGSINGGGEQHQQSQDVNNLLMNALLMMPFWSNMCSTLPLPVFPMYPKPPQTASNTTTDHIQSSNEYVTTSHSSHKSLSRSISRESCSYGNQTTISNDSSIPTNVIDTATGGYVVFVYGIGPDTTADEVNALFTGYGEIIRTDVIKNKHTGVGKGYGFVILRLINDALNAIKALHNAPFKGRFLQVRFRV
ncbi:unnamed protein product [Didymodactylos carnosus]|uniref:RRM domain-containing protein n=3 Tax=Didymodactylos carnosus TaxID=1234261 RepID=A0A8S2RJD0_9BILA|nr:unnamed protein product [Didymodactylos carnosus]CAF4164263.1 unnamed protein product [Didymodactylos carnosus]